MHDPFIGYYFLSVNICWRLLYRPLGQCQPDCAEDIDVEDDENKEGKEASEGQPEPIYVVSEKYFLVSGKYFLVPRKYNF